MVKAKPTMKPSITGLDMKSAMKPSLARPARMKKAPTRMAKAVVSSMKRCWSAPTASGKMTAADMTATVELGPTMSCRDVPKMA